MNEQGNFSALIIDDNPSNLLLLSKSLSLAGYTVHVAKRGAEGRELAKAKNPDIILLDIIMPGEDGFETIQKLKSDPATALIPVIFLTSLDDIESKVKGFEHGAVDYITKPFYPREVRARAGLHIRLNLANKAMVEQQIQRFNRLEEQNAKLNQLEQAQQSLLVQPHELPDAKFHVHYAALLEAGGDFYDVIKIADNTFLYFIADIAGHDIATSFMTSALKALLRQNCAAIYSTAESMGIINRVLLDVLPEGKFLTAACVRVNRDTHKAVVVNMGHLPLIHQTADGHTRFVEVNGDVLGAFGNASYNETEIAFDAGDRLFLYSDGLLETSDGYVWTSRLEDLRREVEALRHLSVAEVVAKLRERTAGAERRDDTVLMGIEA